MKRLMAAVIAAMFIAPHCHAVSVLTTPQRLPMTIYGTVYVSVHVNVSLDATYVIVSTTAPGITNSWNTDPALGYCTQKASFRSCNLPMFERRPLHPWRLDLIQVRATSCTPGTYPPKPAGCLTTAPTSEVDVSCSNAPGSGCPCDVLRTPFSACVYP